MIKHQRGAYYMPTTPWTDRPQLEVDKDAYFKQIQRIAGAAKSIICGAATGEAYDLAPREMIELVAVAIKAVDGKANEACIEFFAKLLKVPHASVSIAAGLTSRNKTVRVVGVSAGRAEAIRVLAVSHWQLAVG